MELWGNSVIIGGQFPKVNNVARPVLAAVDTTTGALDNRVQDLAFARLFNGGTTNVKELDVTTTAPS